MGAPDSTDEDVVQMRAGLDVSVHMTIATDRLLDSTQTRRSREPTQPRQQVP